MKILITGSSGLTGSEAVVWLDAQGYAVLGVDNNMRREFFGPKGDTSWMLTRLGLPVRAREHVLGTVVLLRDSRSKTLSAGTVWDDPTLAWASADNQRLRV